MMNKSRNVDRKSSCRLGVRRRALDLMNFACYQRPQKEANLVTNTCFETFLFADREIYIYISEL